MAHQLRLKATGELATWDACDVMGKGIRIALESEGRLDLRISNGVSYMGHVLTAADAESLRAWLNTRHDEAVR